MAGESPRPRLVGVFKGVCHLVAFLVLVQAALAGLFVSGEEHGAKDWHEALSNIIFLAVVAQLVLAFLLRGWGQFRLMYWVALLFVLLIAQTGLGYASEDEAGAEAVHIPLGVFIFGLGVMISTLAYLEARGRSAGS